MRLRGLPAEEIAEEIADFEAYFDQCTKFAEEMWGSYSAFAAAARER